MDPRSLIKVTLAASLVGALGAFGCSVVETEDADSSGGKVVAGTGAVLKSTLFLKAGCTGAKVGPRHILVAARCVDGNEALTAGKPLEYTLASAGPNGFVPMDGDPPVDAGTRPRDGGTAPRDAGRAADAAATTPDEPEADGDVVQGQPKIAEVKVHTSYTTRCKDDVCALGKIEGSDAADVAVIVLDQDLTSITTIPIDLDAVGQSDAVLAVHSGCATIDTEISASAKATRTIAVPAKSVNHAGSPYQSSPALSTRVGSSYIVTGGIGWKDSNPSLCRADLGAPLFRAASAAVVGVTSNFTSFADAPLVPVTVMHSRVDTGSRFKIGAWLQGLGAETVHTCSETAGGCPKKGYDGGVPSPGGEDPGTTEPGDGGDTLDPDGGLVDETDGGDVLPPEDTAPQDGDPRGDQLPGEGDDSDYSGEEDDFGDAGVKKKKKKAAGGCTTAPGQAPTGELALGAVFALGALVVRRRRSR